MANSRHKRIKALKSKLSPKWRVPTCAMTQSNCPAPDRRSAGIGYRLSGIGNPTSDIRHPLLSPEFALSSSLCDEFAEALREARLRSEAGDPIPQTPITAEMMEDPVDGEFWRQMFEARERVRLLRR